MKRLWMVTTCVCLLVVVGCQTNEKMSESPDIIGYVVDIAPQGDLLVVEAADKNQLNASTVYELLTDTTKQATWVYPSTDLPELEVGQKVEVWLDEATMAATSQQANARKVEGV